MFVRLTRRADNPCPIWIRAALVQRVSSAGPNQGTVLGFGGEEFEIVTEPPEVVMAAIEAVERDGTQPAPQAPEAGDDRPAG